MNLLELKTSIDSVINNLHPYQRAEEIPILITTDDDCIGCRAYVNIKYISMGFDWEANQCRISTDRKIIQKKKEEIVEPIQKSFEGRKYWSCIKCGTRLSKQDNYCKTCGRKLK